MQPPIRALTGLRFVAAFTVLISHSVEFMLPNPGHPWWHLALNELAGIGMPLFFVLSGFVIHYNYSVPIGRDGLKGIYNFFVARFARLYPLFIVCVGFDLIFKYLYGQLPPTTADALPYYLTMTQTWVYELLGDHGLPAQFGVMPSVSWSISTEWFFYLAYPLIHLSLMRLRRPKAILIVAASIAVAAVVIIGICGVAIEQIKINDYAIRTWGPIADFKMHAPDSFVFWLFYYSPYSRIAEFLVGALAAHLFMQVCERPPSATEERWGTIVLVVALTTTGTIYAVLWCIFAGAWHWWDMYTMSFGLAPFLAVIVFCTARYQSLLATFLSLPKIVLCGEASYSLYLLHLEIIYAFRWTVSPILWPGIAVANVMRWGLLVLTAIGLSIVTWHLIEMPARRWVRNTFTIRVRTAAIPRDSVPASLAESQVR